MTGSTGTVSPLVSGYVKAGSLPVAGASVQLYAAGHAGNGSAATALLTVAAVTDSAGVFGLSGYACPADDPIVYLVARGGAVAGNGNGGLALMNVLGPCSGVSGGALPTVNEVTTVASAYAFHPFLAAGGQLGASATNRSGLLLAQNTLLSLVDPGSGSFPGPMLPANSSSPAAQISSLANLLNACAVSSGASSAACGSLYSNTELNGTTPGNTLDALVNLVTQPATHVAELYALSQTSTAFGSGLTMQPSDWTLFLTLSGSGMYYPTGLALDSAGKVWVANLGNVASQFDNTGAALFPNGITGYGLGFSLGVAVDSRDLAWITNWQSSSSVNGGAGTVTLLGASGGSVTTSAVLASGMNYAAAAAVDTDGTVWLANYGNASAAHLRSDGTPLSGPDGYRSEDIAFPTAVAVDSKHAAWLANISADSVSRVSEDGSSITAIHCCAGPAAVAVDASDYVWVANYYASSVALISPAGQILSSGGFTGGGIQFPNGIAIDGGGNVWVANLNGPSLTELAGSAASSPGAALSPAAGWGPDAGLLGAYGIAVDAAGSVWVTAKSSNTLVKFIGVAAPAKTPLVGPVQAP